MVFILLVVIAVTGISFAVYAHIQMKRTASQPPPKQVGYVLILGAKVNGTVMSKSLLYRAAAALRYLQENPASKAIASGGMGKGEDVTEAQAIASYLVNHGIDEERILLEKESTSTSENLLFSKQLYPIKEAVIVSNDFHLFRATSEADKIGIKAYPLAAKTPTAVKWKLYIREYAAILKMTITGK
ncbi:YdcF family protein [Virgibacillus halophilus]|uniref:YdcF family protein n=1 Tax=Tigheibacillus halophilus TaxID=361280 RepID=UPI003624EEAC